MTVSLSKRRWFGAIKLSGDEPTGQSFHMLKHEGVKITRPKCLRGWRYVWDTFLRADVLFYRYRRPTTKIALGLLERVPLKCDGWPSQIERVRCGIPRRGPARFTVRIYQQPLPRSERLAPCRRRAPEADICAHHPHPPGRHHEVRSSVFPLPREPPFFRPALERSLCGCI